VYTLPCHRESSDLTIMKSAFTKLEDDREYTMSFERSPALPMPIVHRTEQTSDTDSELGSLQLSAVSTDEMVPGQKIGSTRLGDWINSWFLMRRGYSTSKDKKESFPFCRSKRRCCRRRSIVLVFIVGLLLTYAPPHVLETRFQPA
jgi:hypothetical protein